jgi:hypothetical protein
MKEGISERIAEINRLKSEYYGKLAEAFRNYSGLMRSENARSILEDEIGFLESMSRYFEGRADPVIDLKIREEIDLDNERFGLILRFYPRNTSDGEKMSEMIEEIEKINDSYRNKIEEVIKGLGSDS